MNSKQDTLDYLRYLTYKGVKRRYGVDISDAPATLASRVEHELATLEKAGFEGYMLIVADILRYCREKDIPTGPGRGSVCGSVVAYTTQITDVDPLRFGIPFERFLHLERIAQPDIDLDICQARRQEVIEYLRDTYGRESVAQIVTFTPLNAKGVVRDVCRVLHVDAVLRGIHINETGDRLAKSIPEGSGADQWELEEFMSAEEGKQFAHELSSLEIPFDGEMISVLQTCLTLEGLRKNTSVHAAGVVIADRPLTEIAPIYKKNKDADIQVQYDMRDCETVGLLKMDVLGLRTVTVLGEIEKLVRQNIPDFSIKTVPLDDKKTFALLEAGDTVGVFQLEGEGITHACKGMKPDRFEDVIDLIALYRPGPMEQLGSFFNRKHGKEEITYDHPELRNILDRTYGLMVYQEQVMGIVRWFGGYTAGEADMFRKAIGKKLVPLIRSEIDGFMSRAVAKGYEPKFIEALGDSIFYFGRYGFNLGHATGYGFITYWTAYAKANHPAEFYCANLNSYVGDLDRIGRIIRDATKHGISILPPDINKSGFGFTLVDESEGRSIRFGIGGIKGVGESMVRDILEYRDSTTKNGYSTKRISKVKPDGTAYKANSKVVERVGNVPSPYRDYIDFCSRLAHVPINAKENLVVSGAFGIDMDFRIALLSCAERANASAKSGKPFNVELDRSNASPELELLRREREVLGFFISRHPLAFYKSDIERYGASTFGHFDELDSQCTVAGLVLGIRPHQSKNGEMAWISLETDIANLPDITAFASVWKPIAHLIEKDDVIVVSGRKDFWAARSQWTFKADSIHIINRATPDIEVFHVSIVDTDISDLLYLRSLSVGDGAFVQIAIEDCERVALLTTGISLPATGATLKALESKGWIIHINPHDNTPSLPWKDGKLVKSNTMYAGSGEDRKHVSDLPLIKRACAILDAEVIAELKRTDT